MLLHTNMLHTNDDIPTIEEIRACIPPHCFKRSFVKSFFFIVRDILLASAVSYVAFLYLPFENTFINWILWTVYALINGTIVFGLWVIGHECGHGAFCDNQVVSDLVGFVLHTALLVPYFAWQHTHAVHHGKCNHLLDGETHNPVLSENYMLSMIK